jgi:hypothetical protein
MPLPSPTFRLQGTDGIRQVVTRSTDHRVFGMTPLRVLLDQGLLTEQLVELYCFAYAASLPTGSEVVVGWDPRDPQGHYTEAAVAGVRKAGATSVVVGVLPTPGIALYQIWRGATASIVITASHNPRDQNGIKVFQGSQAEKPLPVDDQALTRRIFELDYVQTVAPLPLRGAFIDAQQEAASGFEAFHRNPRNTWLEEGVDTGTFPLIVDTANGALASHAARILRHVHSGQVIEVNADSASGLVNTHGGVADLEGVSEIHRGDVRFQSHLFGYDTPAFKSAEALLTDDRSLGSWEVVRFDDEPDMLFANAKTLDGDLRAAVFIRKSGTENKIGISVRGSKGDAPELLRIGEELTLDLATVVKDMGDPMTMAQLKVVQALASGPLSEERVPVFQGILSDRLLAEMTREGVILQTPIGFKLTRYGARMLEILSRLRT